MKFPIRFRIRYVLVLGGLLLIAAQLSAVHETAFAPAPSIGVQSMLSATKVNMAKPGSYLATFADKFGTW